jgi:hypothetical protein
MSDRPQDRPEDRRRRGPLGDEEGTEDTRPVPRGGEDAETGQLSSEGDEREGATRENVAGSSGGTVRHGAPDQDDPHTRVIRTPGGPDAYEDEEVPFTREERLRDVYGGVDWLASFVGCVVALVCMSVLLLLISGLVLGPLGLTLDLAGGQLDSAIITGLVIVGLVLFLSYFFGGYVAGRLVRFDGGRNGAATVAWGILLAVIFALFGFLLVGPRPDGSLPSRDEQKALKEVSEPIARAIRNVVKRVAYERRLESMIESNTRRLDELEAKLIGPLPAVSSTAS